MQSSENDFYVYLHTKKTTGDVFYVGKGRGYRFKSKSGRNNFWHRVVNKHGFNAEILFEGMSEAEALDAEINAIIELRSLGFRLCNKVNGGGGTSGLVHSDATKKSISENNARYWTGRRRSDETKEIISRKKLANGDSKGAKNSSYDNRIFSFVSPSGVVVNCTKYELYSQYRELSQPKVSLLAAGKIKTSKGWRCNSVVQ